MSRRYVAVCDWAPPLRIRGTAWIGTPLDGIETTTDDVADSRPAYHPNQQGDIAS